ncbi:Uncharacterized protein FWK35_00024897 [Aphis craccivora]|uniref:Uncharacterized protein n=1 Tax=Aphis craccivora TaxID=307492 RepID=A0A6G0WYY6_APHCR|nr:Uncharacterized protein FWK35_00024897 [Aphis craccivora]
MTLISMDSDLISKINNIFLAIKEIKKSVSKHDSLFSELNNKLDQVSNQLRDLGSRSASLENRMDKLESHLSNAESSNSSSDELLIFEVLDKQSRARNLIFFNLPESNNSNSSEEDKLLVKSVLDTLSPNLGTAALARLGRKYSYHFQKLTNGQTTEDIKFYFQNVRGLNTKLNTLMRNVNLSNYDLIGLFETWLSSNVDSSELGLINYYLSRVLPVPTSPVEHIFVIIKIDLNYIIIGINFSVC